ncbi:MAG: formylglycine-generating enzyme family protein [Anaerolineales bacterium]
MKLKLTTYLMLGIAFLASGCGPSESEQIATITQIAAGIIATQTANAPTATPTPTLSPGDTRTSPVDGMTMVYIPPGEYTLGSTEEDVEWAVEQCGRANSSSEYSWDDECDTAEFQDEMPQHTVRLDPYWIDQTEVTVAMFAQFVDETGYKTVAERFQYKDLTYTDKWRFERNADWSNPFGLESATEDLKENPVVNVSWQDAWTYCEWAGRRLPTEAEWEAAARGMDLRIFPWGDESPLNNHANLTDDRSIVLGLSSSYSDGYMWISPVMSFPEGASPFGVLGMAGNVKEWVYDWYSPVYDLPPLAENPINTTETEMRVRRSGSFDTYLSDIRTASRAGSSPYWTASDLGFRCVLSELELPDPPEQDSSPPDAAFGDWRTVVYDSVDIHQYGYLKSFSDLEILGQYSQCEHLKISTPDYPEGWLHAKDDVTLYKDCSDFEEIFIRPASKNWYHYPKGFGVLTVKNQGESDAYLVLVDIDNEESYEIYVRAGEQVIMEDILDGTYEVYTTSGTTWVSYDKRFKDAVSYEKLTEPMVFTSTETQATWWEIVLQTVEGGNTGSIPINESDFP